MKRFIYLSFFSLFIVSVNAQQNLSIDLAAIRNTTTPINGGNISLFYHFNERLSAGVEMNRFFETHVSGTEMNVKNSAWDFDYNAHYYIPLVQEFKCYPIMGFSHTSETERIQELYLVEDVKTKFWSYNYGVGLCYEIGKWSPHVEYLFTQSFKKVEGEYYKQQFLLAGVSYEFHVGHHKSTTHHKS